MQTDRHDGAINCFSQFCQRAKKHTLVSITGPWLGSKQDICLMEGTCYCRNQFHKLRESQY